MDCRKLERHLDEHGPDLRGRGLLEHVARCPACSAAVRVAGEVEAALQETGREIRSDYASARAPEGFAERVLTRIETAEQRLAAPARGEAERSSRWVALAADPLVSVTITLAFLIALLAAWHPAWGRELPGWGALWLDRSASALGSQAREAAYAREGLAAALAPVTLWITWRFLRLLGRALVLRATRPGV